jgi:hypothetical protein
MLVASSPSTASSGSSAVGPTGEDPRVVDQDVDPAPEGGDGPLGEIAGRGGRGGEVRGHGHGIPSGRGDRGDDARGARLIPSVDEHAGAGGGEHVRDRLAEAAGGSGHDRGAAGQPGVAAQVLEGVRGHALHARRDGATGFARSARMLS